MQFHVAKADLERALQTVSGGCSSTGNDLTTHFLFRVSPKGDANRMEVLTYSGRVAALCPFIANLTPGDENAFTMEGWRLREWIKGVPESSVIKFSFDGEEAWGSYGASTPQNFQSLDPQNFPFWDKVLDASKSTAKVNAGRLRAALDAAKSFASTDESKTPEVCVCQVHQGTMVGTDKIGALRVAMPELGACTLRVHVKDVPGVSNFLSLMTAQEEVEILEHDRSYFLRRGDGAYFGESRFSINFPTFSLPPAPDQRTWGINVTDLRLALLRLKAVAVKENDRVRVHRPTTHGPLILSVPTPSGKTSSQEVLCTNVSQVADAPALPKDGFYLRYDHINQLLGLNEGDVLPLGVNSMKNTGFLRFTTSKYGAEGVPGDEYIVIIVWLR